MLEAKMHHISARDVAHILVDSAKFPPKGVSSSQNGAGRAYNDYIGFGTIDAGEALRNTILFTGLHYPRV